MDVKLNYSELRDIPPFESIIDQQVRLFYERNARHLEQQFGDRLRAIIESEITDPELAARLHHRVMYLITHTEVQHPVSATSDSPAR